MPARLAFTLFLILVSAASSTRASGTTPPTYRAEPCCSLCPRAADPATYVSRFMRDQRVTIQGKDDWLFRTEVDLSTDFTVDEDVYQDLARLVRALNAHGTQVLLLDLPRRGLLNADKLLPAERAGYDAKTALANYRRALQRFRQAGFIVPDYGRLVDAPDGTDYYFRRDGHWTPDGARRTAELIAETIQAMPMYAGFRKTNFVTRQVERHPGVLSIAAAQICGGSFPSEVVSGYDTSPSRTFPFGDEPVPEIALVGTSFSAGPAYHFAGFLQQKLQADVLNVSLSGGNFDGAMTQYLPSDTFQLNPPKLLIWEFAHPQIAAANRTQMRRLVPLADDGCIGKKALLANDLKISADADFEEVLFNGGDKRIDAPSRDLRVDLQFEDQAVAEILGEAWYLDGKHEVVKVRMNDYTRANGRFVLELNREPDYSHQPLVDFRVHVVTPLKQATGVSAKLCRSIDHVG